jgi:hypothetical protein
MNAKTVSFLWSLNQCPTLLQCIPGRRSGRPRHAAQRSPGCAHRRRRRASSRAHHTASCPRAPGRDAGAGAARRGARARSARLHAAVAVDVRLHAGLERARRDGVYPAWAAAPAWPAPGVGLDCGEGGLMCMETWLRRRRR